MYTLVQSHFLGHLADLRENKAAPPLARLACAGQSKRLPARTGAQPGWTVFLAGSYTMRLPVMKASSAMIVAIAWE